MKSGLSSVYFRVLNTDVSILSFASWRYLNHRSISSFMRPSPPRFSTSIKKECSVTETTISYGGEYA